MTLSAYQSWFAAHKDDVLDQYFSFLSFKSISADPAFSDDVRACANWLEKQLADLGLETEIWETGGHPALFAEKKGSGPTLLIYHHYDVQPVDPIELWKTDPFTPEIREGNVYARGAVDNKGQCAYSLAALKAFLELCPENSLHIKYFIEGEEEIGSPTTMGILEKKKKELKSDFLLAVDSHLPAPNVAAMTLGLRGIVTCEMTCQNGQLDLHSGNLGGAVLNPLKALSSALCSLWDEEGKVAIEGFYDGVEIEEGDFYLDFDKKRVSDEFGVNAFTKEPGFTEGESIFTRPTVEINGLWGGYIGEGFKTVLPHKAHAKVSCRLVAGQDPDRILMLLEKALRKALPEGLEFTFKKGEGAPAFRARGDSTIANCVAKAYEEVMEKTCKKTLLGGSIPIVTNLANVSQAETIMVGFGLDEDGPHAPNEHFGLDRFEQGLYTMGKIFSSLSET